MAESLESDRWGAARWAAQGAADNAAEATDEVSVAEAHAEVDYDKSLGPDDDCIDSSEKDETDDEGAGESAALAYGYQEGARVEEGGEAECRVCGEVANSGEQGPSTNSNPLLAPCACRGSVAHIHRSCLRRWVATASQQPSLSGFEHALKCNACLAPWRLGPRQGPAAPPTWGGFLRECVLPECRPAPLLRRLGAALSHVFVPTAAPTAAPGAAAHPCDEHLCCAVVRLLAAAALAAVCLAQARVALALVARFYAKVSPLYA